MTVSVTLNLGALDRAAHVALRRTVREVERALPEAHEQAVYGWDAQTRRSDGRVVGSPRDVVDTGELRDSQQPATYPSPDTAVIEWLAEHAAATYLGAVMRDGSSRPARNVPLNTLRALDLGAALQKHLAGLL